MTRMITLIVNCDINHYWGELIYSVWGIYNVEQVLMNMCIGDKFNLTSHVIETSCRNVIYISKTKRVSINNTIILSYEFVNW